MGFAGRVSTLMGPEGPLVSNQQGQQAGLGVKANGVRIPLNRHTWFPEANPRRAAHEKGERANTYCVPCARPLLGPGRAKSLGSSHFTATETEAQRTQATYSWLYSRAWT